MRLKDIKIFHNFFEKSTVEERFKMCFYKGDEYLNPIGNSNIDYKLGYEELYKLLKDNELESYCDLLINYQNTLFEYFSVENTFRSIVSEIHANNSKEFKYVELLKFLYDNVESNWGVNIILTNNKGSRLEIRDKKVTSALIGSMKTLFTLLDMNRRPFNYDEAIEYLKNPTNLDIVIKNYNMNSMKDEIKYENINIDNLPEELIQYLIDNFLNEKMINSTFINERYNELTTELENNKPKKGRKIENSYFGELALNLSYLIRFQRFVLQDEVEHIYDMPISKKDLELIYKYFEFWGIENLRIKSGNENGAKKELKSGYMNVSAWIVKYKNSRGKYFDDIVPNYNEIEIDKYRKIVRDEID